jgi:hypothetical protein
MDAVDTHTDVADMRVAHGRLTVAPIAAELLVRHAAMRVEQPAVTPVAQPEAQPLRLAVAVAAEPGVALAAAAAMPAVAVATAAVAADTGKRVGLRGSPQIAAEFTDKARLLRQAGFAFVPPCVAKETCADQRLR